MEKRRKAMLPMLPETTKSNLERLWALTQHAQQLGSGIVAATAAKAAGREFSIVDAQSVGAACTRCRNSPGARGRSPPTSSRCGSTWRGPGQGPAGPATRRRRIVASATRSGSPILSASLIAGQKW
jgi:hypothetical protein